MPDNSPFAPVCQFKDQETVHLILVDGEWLVVGEEVAENYAAFSPQHKVTIDYVDPATNTLYFSSPLPSDVHGSRRG